MYPNLFNIPNFTYILCMIIGVLAAFFIAAFYLKDKGIKKAGILDLLICGCFAVAGGIVFAVLFENLYEAIALKDQYHFNGHMTFFGGLFGGVITFLLVHYFMRKNCHFEIRDVVKIAPVAITLAHAIGRIGCFFAGCCYGIETDSPLGIDFPNDNLGKVVPTQLIEAIFLFILCGVLASLLLVKDFKYTFVIYALAYGIFRFIIEFYRGDERGVAFALSPSQIWSILLVVGAIPLFFYLKKLFSKQNEKE